MSAIQIVKLSNYKIYCSAYTWQFITISIIFTRFFYYLNVQ